MTSSDILTVVGIIVTILGIIVTIYFANEAEKHEKQAEAYSNQIKSDLRKINLSNCVDRLKNMSDEIRNLPIDFSQVKKGVSVEKMIIKIKAHFDGTLSLIETNGSDDALRNQVSNAQSLLHEYERNYVAKIVDWEKVQHLQIAIQNSISMINSKIYGSEG